MSDVIFKRDLVRLLEHEQFHDHEGSSAYERGYRSGHNARARSLIAWLRMGSVDAGLDELRSVPLAPTVQPCADWPACDGACLRGEQ
jgi:hypothetical protein